MYWYKKKTTDTGNPELVQKEDEDNEASNDKVKDDPQVPMEEDKRNEGNLDSGKENPEVKEQAPNPDLKEIPERTNKIIEPVEEYKMKKELSDLQFTYVLCAT